MSEPTTVARRDRATRRCCDDAFVRELIKQIRAQDTHGTWEGKSDLQAARALHPHAPNSAARCRMMGDPDPDTLWRLDLFHNAIGLAIERATGCMVSPMMKMSHEGFGRMVLTTGRLIVVNRHLRDVHRFGFPSLAKLAEAGNKLRRPKASRMIEKYPEVAHYGLTSKPLKAELKKLNARATQAKMDLHDLSRGAAHQLGDASPRWRRSRTTRMWR